VTVSADPLSYTLGDVLYIPALVGVTLPSGEKHDGYVIVGDYAEGNIDSGADKFSFFTGTVKSEAAENPFVKVGLSDPSNSYQYQNVSEEKAQEVRARHGFKILKTFKKSFKARINPMLEQQ